MLSPQLIILNYLVILITCLVDICMDIVKSQRTLEKNYAALSYSVHNGYEIKLNFDSKKLKI